MNDPGKEAGSWLALALTAHPHFSLAMMRDVQMDLAPSSPNFPENQSGSEYKSFSNITAKVGDQL